MTDLFAIAQRIAPIRGQGIADWLRKFLVVTPETLSKWKGPLTETMTAHIVGILRKRGVVDEYEVQEEKFKKLLTAAYRAPVVTNE